MKLIPRVPGNKVGRIITKALYLLPILMSSLIYCPGSAQADITVTATGPGGSRSQTIPGTGGAFDLSLPLSKNSVNTITVAATDAAGTKVSRDIRVTQLSLDAIVVSKVTAETLSVQQIKQLVNDGVIKLDNPANYNVSKFDIVLTIGNKQVPISVPVVTPLATEETGWETYIAPPGDGGGGSAPKYTPPDVVIFDQVLPPTPEMPSPLHIPGVIIIEGNIKSLKEFYTVRLLLMNTSGIFTLKNVTSSISFPDLGLSSIAPADGIISFGDILPGDGGLPGQAERQFIIRGDEIGIKHVKVNFGGTVAGPGIPEDMPIPFNGAAATQVEVKGPPTFKVVVTHPDSVTVSVPYELKVDITDTGDIAALYTSLALDVGGAAQLVSCDPAIPPNPPVCRIIIGSDVRSFGDIMPGQTVSATFTINPLETGQITSCLGISDQNIALQVQVGTIGCLVGQIAPERGVPDGVPTVQVAPAPNLQGVSAQSPVTAFFSQAMNQGTIFTGTGGTFNVYDKANTLIPGGLMFVPLNGKTVAVWQALDTVYGGFAPLAPNTEYTVLITTGITNSIGTPLYNSWTSRFTTTGTGSDDTTPPTLTLGVEPPVNPSYVLPGQLVKVDAYAADQGSGVVRVELRSKDLTTGDATYQLIDRRVIFNGDKPPFIFTIDSGKLAPGHTYQLLGTAYDFMMNSQNATINLIIAATAAAPTITLPAPPLSGIPQGISVSITPDALTGGVAGVSYFLDGAVAAFKTVNIPPYQAGLGTVTLALGDHTIRAVAVDALGQTGQAAYTFTIVSNPNKPQISLAGTVNGATYIVGSSFVVNGSASDPVGISSLAYYLDPQGGTPSGSPIAVGDQAVTIATAAIGIGAHQLVAYAQNSLGVSNTVTTNFSVVQLPNGPAPSAPVVATVSLPVNGQVTVTGSSANGARIDITNSTQKFGITINANGAGSFRGSLAAAGGDLLSLVAYDYSTSQLASPAATRSVPAPPMLTAIGAAPATMSFTAANAWQDITVTGSYDNASSANLTGQSTFSSSNPSVAAVNASGRVVALKSGSAIITATSGGQQAQVAVTVTIVTLQSISVSPLAITYVYLGESRQLAVTGSYSDGTMSQLNSGVSFVSENPAIAAVTASGLVSATGNGSTLITAYYSGIQPVSVPVTVNTALDTAPQVQILTPATGGTVQRGDIVSVTVRGTDAVGGVTRLILSATGPGGIITTETHQIAPSALDVTTSFTFTVPETLAIGAALTVTAGAVDTGNNSALPVSITLNVVDTSLPVVAITAPSPQAPYNYGDTITLTIHATDRVGVNRIRYAASGAFSSAGTKDIAPAATSADASFTITVPFGAASPNLTIVAYASDAAGNEGSSSPVNVIITNADITPPVTNVMTVATPGSNPSTTITYQITDGLADLDHVELYFRRNSIGTFNRYTDADHGYPDGKYLPQSGNTGTITFDSTKMGGDGSYEFYSVGVDRARNRELAPRNSGPGLVVADQNSIFNAGANWTIIASPATVGEGDTAYDNKNIRITGATTTFTVNGHHSFGNVELLNGAVLTHAPATGSATFKLDMSLWTLTIDATSRIDLIGRGYRADLTEGNVAGSQAGAGGSHGGLGSAYSTAIPAPTYDDFTNPTDLGGGGGTWGGYGGGAGGGLFLLNAINIVNDSAITANGALSSGSAAGNGGGGGINITTRTLSGNGTIEARGGGSGVGTGGGGGRIAVNYLDLSTLNQTGINVDGGQGAYGPRAANGTIFLKQQSKGAGELVIDGLAGGTAWTTLAIPSGYTFDSITLRNSARVVTDSPVHVTGRLLLTGNSTLTHTQGSEAGLAIDAATIQIDAGSVIDTTGRGYNGGSVNYGLTLGGINGSQTGSGGSYGGKGGGYSSVDSGLVYGDPRNPVSLGSGGGSWSGSSYPGGAGGGLVTIHATTSMVVDGAIRADGGLSVGSASGNGSGGSVLIRTSRLAGSGAISANGGGSGTGVGGGGGRVAIYSDYLDNTTSLGNLRNVSSFAGQGYYDTRQASAGTVYVKFNQGSGELFIDDNNSGATASMHTPLTPIGSGASGAVSADSLTTDGQMPLLPGGLAGLRLNPDVNQQETFVIGGNSADIITVVTPNEHGIAFAAVAAAGRMYSGFYRYDNLTFRRGGNLLLGDRLEVPGVLTLAEHGLLSHYAATDSFTSGLYLTLGTLNIDSSSRIDVTGRGYRGGNQNVSWDPGKTAGNVAGSQHGSGGSHGGLGSIYDNGVPNTLYDSLTDPIDLGSGGGNWSTYGSGAGGGRVLITAGNITVDGAIVANGAGSSGSAAGDGSGGTVNITTGSLGGSGAITSNGGGTGTGGGGGRIAIVHSGALTLAPDKITTLGGKGGYGRRGGIGTIFIRDITQSNGALVIDGGNLDVENDTTAIPGTLTFDSIVLRNKARATVDNGLTVTGLLHLTGNSTMTHSPGNEAGIAIEAADIRIDAGSAIDTTSRGYRGGRAGVNMDYGLTLGGINGSQSAAGGSYGGKGGGYQSVDSGLVYGDPRNPILLGSGGGYWPGFAGGNGGGRISIHASTSLVVNGTIDADGGLSSGSAGGDGSGGSVLIRSATLAGAGTISANGGGSGTGVGGGGGRIAVYYDTLDQIDNFNNQRGITAFSGKGGYDTVPASAGTVYFKVNQGAEELFIDDNATSGTAPGATRLSHIGSGATASVSTDSLTVDGNVPLLPNGLAGVRLNPDTTQQETFAIKGNTANTISVVTPNEHGIAFLNYADTGRNYGGVHHYENLTFRRGGNLLLGDPLEVTGTLKLAEHGVMSHFAATDTFTSGLYLTTGTLLIDSTGKIDVTGRGYRGGRATVSDDPGLTSGNSVGSPAGAGGSHGGLGGHYSTGVAALIYDSETNPVDLGGGGGKWQSYGSGAGGGRVLINAGLLSLDGAIITDGGLSGGSVSGSGAGGTVNITATTLTGLGTVSAKGGTSGVGGGGGRIAIRYGGLLGLTDISASGGNGQYGAGTNGTVYLEQR